MVRWNGIITCVQQQLIDRSLSYRERAESLRKVHGTEVELLQRLHQIVAEGWSVIDSFLELPAIGERQRGEK